MAVGLTHSPTLLQQARHGKKRRRFLGRAALYAKARIEVVLKDLTADSVHIPAQATRGKKKKPVLSTAYLAKFVDTEARDAKGRWTREQAQAKLEHHLTGLLTEQGLKTTDKGQTASRINVARFASKRGLEMRPKERDKWLRAKLQTHGVLLPRDHKFPARSLDFIPKPVKDAALRYGPAAVGATAGGVAGFAAGGPAGAILGAATGANAGETLRANFAGDKVKKMLLFRKADPYHDDHGRFDYSPGGSQRDQSAGRPRGRPPGEGPHKYTTSAGRIDSAVNTPDAQRTLFRAGGGVAGGIGGDLLARVAAQRFNAAAALQGAEWGGAAGTAIGGPAGTLVGAGLGAAGGFLGGNALPYVAGIAGDYVGSKIGGALWALKNNLTSARLTEQSMNTRAHLSSLQEGTKFTPRDIAGEVGSHTLGTATWLGVNAAAHIPGPIGTAIEGLSPLARTAAEEIPSTAADFTGYHAGIAHYDATHGGHAGPRGGSSAGTTKVKKMFGPSAAGGGANPGGGMQQSAGQSAGPGGVSGVPGGQASAGDTAPPIMPPATEPPKVPRLFAHPLVDAHPGFDGSIGSLKQSAPAHLFGRKQWGEVKGTPFGCYLRQKIDDVADAIDEAQDQQVMGPHLFGKNFGFRRPNDMNAHLVNSGEGVPANIRFLRRLQAMDDKNKRADLRRLTTGARAQNLQPRPLEDERAYRRRVNCLFHQQSDSPRVIVKVRRKAVEPVEKSFKIQAEIEKGLNPDDQLKKGHVYGWASIIEKDGVPVVDHQGDRINEEQLVKAAHEFMKRRDGGVMHDETGHQIGHVVESVIMTRDLQKALGIDLGKVGWLICLKVQDPRVKAMAQKRLLKAFSIGGRGRRKRAA